PPVRDTRNNREKSQASISSSKTPQQKQNKDLNNEDWRASEFDSWHKGNRAQDLTANAETMKKALLVAAPCFGGRCAVSAPIRHLKLTIKTSECLPSSSQSGAR